MYQTYNATKESYGVIYQTSATAKDMAKLNSAIFRCEYWVVSKETGEIVAMYDGGLIKWEQ